MMPLTNAMPKPMAPYQGSTLIARGMLKLAEKLDYIHVTVGYKGAMLAQHVIEHGASTVLNTEGHPNSWWIYNTVLRDLNAPVYLLTCDNVVDLDFDLLERSYSDLGEPPCLLVPVKPVPGLEGDYVFRDGHVVTRLTRTEKSDIYCSGIQIVNPARISEITTEGADFYSVWNQLIARRELLVSTVYPKHWFAVDTLRQWLHLTSERPWANFQADQDADALEGPRAES